MRCRTAGIDDGEMGDSGSSGRNGSLLSGAIPRPAVWPVTNVEWLWLQLVLPALLGDGDDRHWVDCGHQLHPVMPGEPSPGAAVIDRAVCSKPPGAPKKTRHN